MNVKNLLTQLSKASIICFTLLSGCDQQNIDTASDIEILAPYIRETPPGKQVTSAYMQLTNHQLKSCHLTGATGNFATAIEVHQHSHKNGLMQMRKIDSLELLPEVPVALEPGGYHLMIFGLTKPLIAEKDYPITLTFSDCPSVITRAKVKPLIDN